jgi:hypothetical protein
MQKLDALFDWIIQNQKIILISLFTIIFIYCYWCTYSLYARGGFNYHDLGFINDFAGNAAHMGKPFYLSVKALGQQNHLATHATFSLLILVPFYMFIHSPFLLLGAGLIFIFLTIPFIFKQFEYFVGDLYKNFKFQNAILPIVFLISISLNKYLKSVMTSGHFEFFFFFFACIYLTALIKKWNIWITLLCFIGAVGTREDHGIYLGLTTLSLFFLPQDLKPQDSNFNKKVGLFAFSSFLFTILCFKVFMPYFSIVEAEPGKISKAVALYWSHWGTSYKEIVLNMLMNPHKVFMAAWSGDGFYQINRSFCFATLINPFMFFFNNVGAFIQYTSSDVYKVDLAFYNSAMFLPGHILCYLVGMRKILQWFSQYKNILLRAVFIFVLYSPAAVNIWKIDKLVYLSPGPFLPLPTNEFTKDISNISDYFKENPHLKTAYSTFNYLAYIPNNIQKFDDQRFYDADVMVIPVNQIDHYSRNFNLSAYSEFKRGRLIFLTKPNTKN